MYQTHLINKSDQLCCKNNGVAKLIYIYVTIQFTYDWQNYISNNMYHKYIGNNYGQ